MAYNAYNALDPGADYTRRLQLYQSDPAQTYRNLLSNGSMTTPTTPTTTTTPAIKKPIQYKPTQQQTAPTQTTPTPAPTAAPTTTSTAPATTSAMTPEKYMELAKQFAGMFDTKAQEDTAKNSYAQNMQRLQGDWASRGLAASGASAAAEAQAGKDLATNLAQLKSQNMEKALPFAMQYADQQQAADQFAKTFGLQQSQFDFQKQQQEWQNNFNVQQFDWQKEQGRLELELQKMGISAQQANAAASQAIAQAQLTMQQQQAAMNQALQEAELTGYYNGNPTVAYQNNAFSQALEIVDRLGYIPDALLGSLTPQQQALLQSYKSQGGAA